MRALITDYIQLLKVISFFLIQVLMLGNIAMAADGVVCLDKRAIAKAEKHNLSAHIYIDDINLHDMFIKALKLSKSTGNFEAGSVSTEDNQKPQSLLEKVIAYALRKKQENKGKGFFKQNIIYLLLKKRVDKFEKRGKPYKLKKKEKKKILQDIRRLRLLLNHRRKWIKTELFKEFEAKINNLEKSLDMIRTYGDLEELIALGTELNNSISKPGALAEELESLRGTNELKKENGKKIKRIIIKPRKPARRDSADLSEEASFQGTRDEGIAADIKPIDSVTEVIVQESRPDKSPSEFNETNLFTINNKKPVLEKAIEKLIETYNQAQENLPYNTAIDFYNKIEKLQQSIDSAQKGQFSKLKHEIRIVENELLLVIEQYRDDITAIDQGEKPARENVNVKISQARKNGNRKITGSGKTVKKKDSFAQAVTLYDPEKIKLRSIEEVSSELRGQIGLLEQIIDAEMENSIELYYYNPRREMEGLVIQLNYSEALEKINLSSDIVMQLAGKCYDFKCAQILNSGSKLLLKPANKDGIFPLDFPEDLKEAKFFYMPGTYSEDLQKDTLKEIAEKISGNSKSTGVKVLDYFLRIKSAAKDIEDINELKESLAYTDGFDMFQKAAVNLIVKVKFGLILGPFGTGKTRVVLAGAKNIILKNKKPVFIVAPQHKIADDITLAAGSCGIPVLRCGNKPNRFDPEIRGKYGRHSKIAQTDFIKRYKELNTGEKDNGCLFVGTDLGASFDWLVKELRDPQSAVFLKDVTLIVDEAALINYPELITAVYMLRPDALILAGDHVQFSPYKLASKFSTKVMRLFKRNIPLKVMWRYHCSSFKELISMPFNKVNLLINYRNPWISVDFLQKWYKGMLTLQSISRQRGDFVDVDTFVIEDTSTWEKQSHEKFYPGTNSYCNNTEAMWILKRIKYFLDKGYSADDMAVITYYDGQIRLISDFIDADGDISSVDARILKRNIFTPIRFQGAEKKIILGSLVRSKKVNNNADENYNRKKIGPLFVSDPEFAKAEALLVLLSRHKGKLSLIGNKDTLDALTKRRYQRINYFYSSLFSYKDKIKAYLDAQNIELIKLKEEENGNYDFIQRAI